MRNNSKKILNYRGRKCFFLYPHSVIGKEILLSLIEKGFEVHPIYDHNKLKHLLEKYNDSIVFINIDKALNEEEWIDYTKELINNEETEDVLVGVLTYNDSPTLLHTYLMNIGVTAGFIQLKLGFSQSFNILMKTLVVNDVKGKRKYIRYKCKLDHSAVINFDYKDAMVSGVIYEISIAGFTCVIDGNTVIPRNTRLPKMQLKLKGSLLMASGVVIGMRNDNGTLLHLILFTEFFSSNGKEKICDFIYNNLQKDIE